MLLKLLSAIGKGTKINTTWYNGQRNKQGIIYCLATWILSVVDDEADQIKACTHIFLVLITTLCFQQKDFSFKQGWTAVFPNMLFAEPGSKLPKMNIHQGQKASKSCTHFCYKSATIIGNKKKCHHKLKAFTYNGKLVSIKLAYHFHDFYFFSWQSWVFYIWSSSFILTGRFLRCTSKSISKRIQRCCWCCWLFTIVKEGWILQIRHLKTYLGCWCWWLYVMNEYKVSNSFFQVFRTKSVLFCSQRVHF